MDFLANLLGPFPEPERNEFRGLFEGCPDVTWGLVSDFHDSLLECQRGKWVPFDGLHADGNDLLYVQLEVYPRQLQRLDWIGLIDFDAHGKSFVQTEKSVMWKIPQFRVGSPVNFAHLFSGAFSGWSRAVDFLESLDAFQVGKTIAVDHDPQVMKHWSAQVSTIPCSGFVPLQGNDALKIPVLAPVNQKSWLNLCQEDNVVTTMSPPCQSWSPGGLQNGLLSDNGKAFLHGVEMVKLLQPPIVTVECSESTPRHEHFNVIKALFKVSGYRHGWSSISDIAALTGMTRKRWLAIWFRNDVMQHFNLGGFKLLNAESINWSDEGFSFPIPDYVHSQLLLSSELRSVYGCARFLPPGFKKGLPPNPTTEQILEARVLSSQDVMPTLVASYTAQHNIAEHHLLAKGLFASLKDGPDGVSFHDPFRFVSLLGATLHSPIPVDKQVNDAFANLGNAIAVPHACITILAALNMCKFCELDIASTTQLAWQSRVSSSNSILVNGAKFYWIVPTDRFADCFHCLQLSHAGDDVQFVFDKGSIGFSADANLQHVRERLGLQMYDVRFVCQNQDILDLRCISDFIGQGILICANRPLLFGRFNRVLHENDPSVDQPVLDIHGVAQEAQVHDSFGSANFQEWCFVVDGTAIVGCTVPSEQNVIAHGLQLVQDGERVLIHAHDSAADVVGFPCRIIQCPTSISEVIVLRVANGIVSTLSVPRSISKHDLALELAVTDFQINGHTPQNDMCELNDGDVCSALQLQVERIGNEFSLRVQCAIANGVSLASDECVFIMQCLSKVSNAIAARPCPGKGVA